MSFLFGSSNNEPDKTVPVNQSFNNISVGTAGATANIILDSISIENGKPVLNITKIENDGTKNSIVVSQTYDKYRKALEKAGVDINKLLEETN